MGGYHVSTHEKARTGDSEVQRIHLEGQPVVPGSAGYVFLDQQCQDDSGSGKLAEDSVPEFWWILCLALIHLVFYSSKSTQTPGGC